MRKIQLALAALAISATAATAQNACTLTGNLPENLNGKKIYIVNYDTGEKIDSATVAGGKISFSAAPAAQPFPAALMLDGKAAIQFILEEGNLSLSENGQVTGSPLNDKNEAVAARNDSIYQDYRAKMREIANSGKTQDEMMAEASACQEKAQAAMTELVTATFNANKDNPIGYYMFLQMAPDMTLAEIDATLADAAQWIRESKAAESYRQIAKKLEETAPGKMFTDFEVTTSDGTKARLSDYVGKGEYVLLDFFASWCGPCMRELPNLMNIHSKYDGKGLKMIGLAVWDDPDDTKKCVEERNIPWTIIDNAGQVPTDIYGVSGIPHIIVFAPDGTIAFRGLTGEQLLAAVTALMESDR